MLWFTLQGCYEKVKMWFDENKHVLGTVGMCILIMQVWRGISSRATGGERCREAPSLSMLAVVSGTHAEFSGLQTKTTVTLQL